MRVLVCDDEPSTRQVYRLAFESEGAEVFEAADGDDCLAAARASDPDLVVLDLYMPKRDGLSVLPELRRRAPRAVVLVVSAHPAVEVFGRSRARGAAACFDKVDFLSRIPQVISRFCAAGEAP